MGLFSYFRRFVPNFARISEPLNRLLKKGNKWHWTQQCEEAFNTLKGKLTNHPITVLPDFRQLFKLYVDVSLQGLGAILIQDKDGKELAGLRQQVSHNRRVKLSCYQIRMPCFNLRHYTFLAKFRTCTFLCVHRPPFTQISGENENKISNIPTLVDGAAKFSLHNTLSTRQNTRPRRLFIATPTYSRI